MRGRGTAGDRPGRPAEENSLDGAVKQYTMLVITRKPPPRNLTSGRVEAGAVKKNFPVDTTPHSFLGYSYIAPRFGFSPCCFVATVRFA